MRPLEGNMPETQGFVNVFTKLRRIAILARDKCADGVRWITAICVNFCVGG